MARFGRAFPMPVSKPTPRVLYDTTGAGAISSNLYGTSFSWTHNISGNAVIVGANLFGQYGGGSVFISSIKIGTTSLNLIGSNQYISTYAFTSYFYGLVNPPTGSQTFTVSVNNGSGYLTGIAVNSVSYFNVSSFGTMATATGSGTSVAQTINGINSKNRVVNMIFPGTNGTISGYNQTQRYNVPGANAVYVANLLGDAPGASSVSFSATCASGAWSSVAVPLISC